MENLKELYKKNINIMEFLRGLSLKKENSIEAILTSYDLQAGSYRRNYYENSSQNLYINNKKVESPMTMKEFGEIRGREMADIINQFDYSSVLEVGVGEATTLIDVVKNLKTGVDVYGIDISWSRVAYGNVVLKENAADNVQLSVGDMFNLAFADNSFDIVYTSHCIEPNTTKAVEAVNELFRVANKYVVLLEPSYQLGNAETRLNIEKHCYINNLIDVIVENGYNVIRHELFPVGTYTNQSSMIIIKKSDNANVKPNGYACPISKKGLELQEGNYFCKESFMIYPVIKGIPCLTMDSAILGSKYNEI